MAFENVDNESATMKNPFVNANEFLELKEGDMGDYLTELFQISEDNSTIDAGKLKQCFESAVSTGASLISIIIVLGYRFDKNWNQLCQVMEFFLKNSPFEDHSTVYMVWSRVAEKLVNQESLSLERRKEVALGSIEVAERAILVDLEDISYYANLAQACVNFPDRTDQAFGRIKAKGIESLKKAVELSAHHFYTLTSVKVVLGNAFFQFGEWQEALEVYTGITDMPSCECGGPVFKGLKHRIEFCSSKLQLSVRRIETENALKQNGGM